MNPDNRDRIIGVDNLPTTDDIAPAELKSLAPSQVLHGPADYRELSRFAAENSSRGGAGNEGYGFRIDKRVTLAVLTIILVASASFAIGDLINKPKATNDNLSSSNFANISGPAGTVIANPQTDVLRINYDTVIAQGRTLTANGSVVIQSDTPNALSVQTANGGSLLVADTKTGKVGIGGDPTGTATLQVAGDISAKGNIVSTGGRIALGPDGLRIDNVLVCTAQGCISSSSPAPASPVIDVTSLAYINHNQTFSGINIFSNSANSFSGSGSGLTALDASNVASGTLDDTRLSTNIAKLNTDQTFTGSNIFRDAIDASNAFAVQDASGGETLFSIDTTARSASGGNLVKIGDSTGTDTSTTILVLDSSLSAPSSNLSALDGGLFYNAGTGHVDVIEGGLVKQVCNTTDLSCGGNATTLQQAYDYSVSSPQITLDSSPGAGGLVIQDNATPLGTSLFRVQNNSGASKYLDVSAGGVGVGKLGANYPLDVAGDINTSSGLRINGVLVCDSSGCNAAAGSGNYIQNSTGTQTANYNIRSASSSDVGGVVEGASGQSVDIFDIQSFGGSTKYLAVGTAGISVGGNVNSTGQYRVNGLQISSANLSNDSNLAKLNGTQSFTGNNTFTGTVVSQNASDSTAAFQIQNSLGTSNLLVADTTHTRIAIGQAAANYPLDVAGDINSTTGIRVGGTLLCSAGGCLAASGSGSYIQNGTTVQTANQYTRSNAAGSVTGIFEGASGQSVDILDVQSFGGGTKYLGVGTSGIAVTGNVNTSGQYQVGGSQISSANLSNDSNLAKLNGTQSFTGNNTFTGTVLAQNASNSVTAFQVQNVAGNSYILVNTSGATLSLGNTGIASTIQVGNTTGVVAQTINIGNNSTGGSTNTLVLGSTTGVGTTTIQGGGGIVLNSNTSVANNQSFTANGSALFKDATNSASAFMVQNASSATLLGVDTTTAAANAVTIASQNSAGNGLSVISNNQTSGAGVVITHTDASNGDSVDGIDVSLSNTVSGASINGNPNGSGLSITRSVNTALSNQDSPIFDNSSEGGDSGGGSIGFSGSLTVGNFTNRYLVVSFWFQNASTVGSVTYNGSAMTLIGSVGTLYFYGLVAPAVGTHNIVETTSSGSPNLIYFVASSWYNVNQSTPIGTLVGNTASGSTASLTATTQPNQVVVDSLINYPRLWTPNVAQTVIYQPASYYLGSSYLVASGTSTPMSWTGASGTYYYAGVPLNSANSISPAATISGNLTQIQSNCTVNAGTCADTSTLLNINQQYAGASGTVFSIQSAGTGDLLDANNSSGTVFAVSSTGRVTTKTTTNSTTAFQVQNSSGASLLTVDTSNSNIGLGQLTTGALGTWNTNANALPANRAGADSVVANGYLYVIGGSNANTVYYSKLNSNGSTNSWTTNANSLPATFYASTAVTANGYLYVMANGNANVYYAKLNVDGSTGLWTTNVNSLPAANLVWATSATVNGYIYVMGGDGSGVGVSSVYYAKINADGSVGAWTTSSNSLPTAMEAAASVTVNGYLYVIGGAPTGAQSSGKNTVYYAKTNSDGSTSSWNSSIVIPQNLNELSATTVNGYIYVLGGYNGSSAQSTVYYAKANSDGTVSGWSTNSNALPVARSNASSVAYNGYVYEIGDNSASTVYYASVQGMTRNAGQSSIADQLTVGNGLTVTGNVALQPTADSTSAFSLQSASGGSLINVDSTNNSISLLGNTSGQLGQWFTNANSLPAIRADAASVTANGYVYEIGGRSSSGGWQSTVYYAKLNADGTTGAWQTNANALPQTIAQAGSVVANGYVYVIGGWNGSTYQPTVYYAKLNADGTTGAWQTNINMLPNPRSEAMTTVINGYVYEIGGYGVPGGGSGNTTVYYAKLNADGTTGAWQTNANVLPQKVSNAASVVANGYVYEIGGCVAGTCGSGNTTVYYAKLNADGTTGAWQTNANVLPGNRFLANAIVLNGYVHIIGGYAAVSGSPQSTVYYAKLNADGTVGAWYTDTNTMPSGRGGAALMASNGYVYSIGGSSDYYTTYTSTIYYASAARIQVGANLDLVGLQGGTLSDPGDQSLGSVGGSLTAGNGLFVGSLQVQGATSMAQGLSVGGALTVNSTSLFKASNPHTNAFQVQTTTGAQALNINTGTTPNLISNGDFESSTSGWSGKGSATIARNDTTALGAASGVGSLAITTTALANDGASFNYTFAASTQYTLSLYAYSVTSISTINIGRQDVSGTDIDCLTAQTVSATWTRYTCTFTTGATITPPTQIYIKQSDATARTFYIDGVQLEQASSASAFQASQANFQIQTATNSITLDGSDSGQLSTWTTSANSLLSLNYLHSSVSANGYVYVIGGTSANVYYAKLNSDGSVGTWTTSSNALPGAIWGHGSIVANGYAYVIGGGTSGSGSAIYYAKLNADGSTGVWQTNTNALPASVEYVAANTYNGYAYAIGGAGTSTIYYAKLNADGSTGVWQTNTNALPQTTDTATSVMANGYTYVLGGWHLGVAQTTVYYAKLNSDGSVGTWTTATNSLPAARGGATSVVSNGYVYEIGGSSGSSIFNNEQTTVYYAKLNSDGSIGAWVTNSNALPTTRAAATSVLANGYIYEIGGNNGFGQTTVYYASTARVQIGANLDLVGLQGGTLSDPGGLGQGSTGGSIIAGNITAVGALQVQGAANFAQGIGINGRLSVAGQSTFQNTTDSSIAFQIQNSTGQGLFVADTTHQQIAIGPAAIPANGALTIGTNTTAASDGLYFGTDTNLYRSVANTLKTDGSLIINGSLQYGAAGTLSCVSVACQQDIATGGVATMAFINSGAGSLQVGIAGSAANGILTVGTDTTVASGGLYFGTDTNLYRSAASTLTTDGTFNAGTLQQGGAGVILTTTTAGGGVITGAFSNLQLATGAVTSTNILDGTVLNADIAGSAAIAYSKLNLAGSIVNADISATAAIGYSKLSLTGSIVNADISASAAIAYSKLNLAGSIVNADISGSAAIDVSKISFVAAKATGGGVSIANGSETTVNLPTEDFDTTGMHSNNQYITIPTTGYYQVTAWTEYSGGTGSGLGIRKLYLYKNSAVLIRTNTMTASPAGWGTDNSINEVLSLSAGDTLYMTTYQSSGGATNLDNAFLQVQQMH